jgi:four helix bundle protein
MNEKRYLSINDISSYKIAYDLSNYVWNIVINWNYFCQRTIGIQFVRSVDSISANIAEGFGRFNKKEKIHFYRYSQGSLIEAKDWNLKAKKRNLLNEKEDNYIKNQLEKLPREINHLIKFTGEKLLR